MKEEGKDHASSGFREAEDGWHKVEFQQGIDFLPGKDGVGIYQNDEGFKTIKFPVIIKDVNDPSNDVHIDQLISMGKGGPWLANICACVNGGLWDAIIKKFPGKDVTVFDPQVLDGIKAKLPSRTCYMRTERDKEGKARTREMASEAVYNKLMSEQKSDKKSTKETTQNTKKEAETPVKPGDDWDS